MYGRFLDYISEKKLLKGSERILLAVSGGIDSMAMAHLMIKAGYKTALAHCNFSLRGREADLDELFVKKYALKNKITFHSVRFETLEYASKQKISVQMAARELRYRWLEQLRRKNKYDLVAVAHNLNDNIETLLINMVRGTGLSGLKGISIRSGHIIRPLLFATRDEITAYCKAEKIRFREDKSNSETKYTRNKIRHKVLPVLKEINPSVEYTLNEFTARAAELEYLINSQVRKIRKENFRVTGDECHVSVEKVKKILLNESLAFEVFKPFNLSGALISNLKKMISGASGAWITSTSHRFIIDRRQLIITPNKISVDNTLIINSLAELKKCKLFKELRLINSVKGLKLKKNPKTAMIDAGKLTFPLIVRTWHKGDFFYPFGMDRKKKLSDFFIDCKYSIAQKEKALILESGGRIVWIIGKRTDNRFRITESTEKVLLLTCQS
jgi:tRNA(Ile)-lysidine synthase